MRRPLLRALLGAFPARRPSAHKGEFGHLLLVGGSRGMVGAAALAARAALRSGCGLLSVALPASQQRALATLVPEAMTLGLPEDARGRLGPAALGRLKFFCAARRLDALALGPGLGRSPGVSKTVLGLLRDLALPAVVDADALNALAASRALAHRARRAAAPRVYTPHAGELGRLLGLPVERVSASREASLRAALKAYGGVWLLKGRRTLVSDGDALWVNPSGNPGLAKGGSGDVLTGVIASLLCQRAAALDRSPVPEGDAARAAFEAAALGAYVHGLAADLAVRGKSTRSLLAGDVVEALPRAFKSLGL